MTKIALRVNGDLCKVETNPDTPLIFVLRGSLGLMGPKLGCAQEQCGACTVLIDGEATQSCVRAVAEFEGKEITTIEGLSKDQLGQTIQNAFISLNAAQCGYCTPGLITTATAFLKKNSSPTREEIQKALETNLCRCGSHNRVLAAIERAIKEGHHGQ